ncbi:MAG: hypothetical protein KDD84_21310, partial [Caldilineaceae bacterium]|nr:hypothetical protein [Caldilineaceae bacterium]
GLAAGGVAGMKLQKGEKIVYAGMVDPQGDFLTGTANGYTKRTAMNEYSTQGRAGSGIIAHKLDKRTGDLIDGLVVNRERRDLVVFVTDKGVAKPMDLDEVPALGRSTLGQNVLSVARGDQVIAVKAAQNVPGFVGDDTLAPPAAESNGKASRSEVKTTTSTPPAPSPAVAEKAVTSPKAKASSSAKKSPSKRAPAASTAKDPAPPTGATAKTQRAPKAATMPETDTTVTVQETPAAKTQRRSKATAKTASEAESTVESTSSRKRQRATPQEKSVTAGEDGEKRTRSKAKAEEPAPTNGATAQSKPKRATRPPKSPSEKTPADDAPQDETPIQPSLLGDAEVDAPSTKSKTGNRRKGKGKGKLNLVSSVTKSQKKK